MEDMLYLVPVGIVDLDLYAPQLNFVFGQAAIGGRAALGLISLEMRQLW